MSTHLTTDPLCVLHVSPRTPDERGEINRQRGIVCPLCTDTRNGRTEMADECEPCSGSGLAYRDNPEHPGYLLAEDCDACLGLGRASARALPGHVSTTCDEDGCACPEVQEMSLPGHPVACGCVHCQFERDRGVL